MRAVLRPYRIFSMTSRSMMPSRPAPFALSPPWPDPMFFCVTCSSSHSRHPLLITQPTPAHAPLPVADLPQTCNPITHTLTIRKTSPSSAWPYSTLGDASPVATHISAAFEYQAVHNDGAKQTPYQVANQTAESSTRGTEPTQ